MPAYMFRHERFVCSVWNGDDVHDGRIGQVVVDSDPVLVLLTYEGRLVVFEFAGVHEVKQNRPEGMMLYSLSEMDEIPPLRRFVFANWADEDDAYLEIMLLAGDRLYVGNEDGAMTVLRAGRRKGIAGGDRNVYAALFGAGGERRTLYVTGNRLYFIASRNSKHDS